MTSSGNKKSFTGYSSDATYWTMRKQGDWYKVVRLASGSLVEAELLGWYRNAGSAATAVGVLAYLQGLEDAKDAARKGIQDKINSLGGWQSIPAPDSPSYPEVSP